jgi:hypothetical protein
MGQFVTYCLCEDVGVNDMAMGIRMNGVDKWRKSIVMRWLVISVKR